MDQFKTITVNHFIEQNGVMTPTQCLLLEQHADGGTVTIPVTTFQTMFGTQTTYTYADLSGSKYAAQGWQKYFDDWKSKGYVS